MPEKPDPYAFSSTRRKAKRLCEIALEELEMERSDDWYRGLHFYRDPHDHAIACVDIAVSTGLASGRSFRTIAAASVYLTGLHFNMKRTQHEVADVCGCNHTSISPLFVHISEEIAERTDE